MVGHKISLDEIFGGSDGVVSSSRKITSDDSQYVYYDKDDGHVAWPTDRIKVRRDLVDISTLADFEAMLDPGFFCGGTRRGRHQRYNQIVNGSGYKGPYGISEGDSWHLYPFLIKEIIDQFIHGGKDSLAIWSTDCAGDTLEAMWQDRNKLYEYLNYLRYHYRERMPSFMLLSGGGNDLLGSGRLYVMLKDFQAGMGAKDLIDGVQTAAAVSRVMYYFDLILDEMGASYPMKVIIHGYDYPVPMNDIWIEKPMRQRSIVDKKLQREVIREFMDYYNDRLRETLGKHSNAKYVDVRNLVTDEADWHDEIHPKSRGFEVIARKIRREI
ncbi:MAG TPA: SGNH/GDSL hydrolase family protein [Aestuariivirga sp.]|nr:SGNH/GDSL hydrolase family protein [Aestuariivirga sp.]